jgi:ASPIC and UnbV
LRPHIGLGSATTVQRLEIRWPGGPVQVFHGPIDADATYEITEGHAALKRANPPAQPGLRASK